MKLTIKSKVLNTEITFSRPGKTYIFADINGKEGTLGVQICKGGKTAGGTLSYDGDDKAQFNKICRNWLKSYVRAEAAH